VPVDVLIVLGSASDGELGRRVSRTLADFGVPHDMMVASAHRSPERLRRLVMDSDAKVFVAIAGMSAALPGTVAALTTRPVVGVPASGKLNLDAVLSVSQMPPGVPVAAVALDGAENAAILAVEILALSDPTLHARLEDYRRGLAEKVEKDSAKLKES
jgi:5-(carboxyamino)imidazole ribonucleotide mutase